MEMSSSKTCLVLQSVSENPIKTHNAQCGAQNLTVNMLLFKQ